MALALLNDTDIRVRGDVMRELEWDSQVDASAVGVSARDGVVTLTGLIDTYAEKLAAERAAKRVRGVRAVANDIRVRLRVEMTDSEIAAEAARMLNMRIPLPDSVQAVVHDGHVTLTGTVPTLFQRAVAEKALRFIKGIKSVVNRIVVEPQIPAKSVKRDLQRALARGADLRDLGITATVSHGVVTLTGNVRSLQERDSAEAAATHAPGIIHVENLLVVVPERGEDEALSELC